MHLSVCMTVSKSWAGTDRHDGKFIFQATTATGVMALWQFGVIIKPLVYKFVF